MDSLKLAIEVQAGIVPGSPLPELTRRWVLTGAQYEEAVHADAALGTITDSVARLAAICAAWAKWDAMHAEATEYARRLMNPAMMNWVRLDWVWT